MRVAAPRCSRISRDLGEDQRGTASVVTNWILLEQPGPWGYRALTQSRLPSAVAGEMEERARRLGIRVVLIRRHGRSSPEGRACFFVHAGEARPWVERLHVDSAADVLDVDWSPLGRGDPVGVARAGEEPVFLVCTNGARDPCCAERGRAVAAALERSAHDVWECSHIGGDRFAANLVCFPHGIYYGRVAPGEAVELARSYGEGVLGLAHYRGRACYDFATQAAETFLREQLDLRSIDEVHLAERTHRPHGLEAAFETSAGRARVVVAVEHGEARRLTCHSTDAVRPPVYRLVAVEGPT